LERLLFAARTNWLDDTGSLHFVLDFHRVDADIVSLQCKSSDDYRIADFDRKQMQIECEHMEFLRYTSKFVSDYPFQQSFKIWRDFEELGETRQVKAAEVCLNC